MNRNEIAQILFETYVAPFVLDVPPIEDNPELRNTLIEGARQYKTGAVGTLHKRIVAMILNDVLRKIGFKSKDAEETLYWRGVARGVQLYEESLKVYQTLKPTKKDESANQADG